MVQRGKPTITNHHQVSNLSSIVVGVLSNSRHIFITVYPAMKRTGAPHCCGARTAVSRVQRGTGATFTLAGTETGHRVLTRTQGDGENMRHSIRLRTKYQKYMMQGNSNGQKKKLTMGRINTERSNATSSPADIKCNVVNLNLPYLQGAGCSLARIAIGENTIGTHIQCCYLPNRRGIHQPTRRGSALNEACWVTCCHPFPARLLESSYNQ